jgi:hypothetical protein
MGLTCHHLQLLHEQNKHDDMLSDLADGMGRILPVIEAALDLVSINDEKGLMKGAISGLCELIERATPFILGYVKLSPASASILMVTGRTLNYHCRESSQINRISKGSPHDRRLDK